MDKLKKNLSHIFKRRYILNFGKFLLMLFGFWLLFYLVFQLIDFSPISQIYIIGYGIGTIGSLPIMWALDTMWGIILKLPGYSKDLIRFKSMPFVLGMIERVLYIGSLQVGHAEFIAFWLTIKTVSQSPRWGEKIKESESEKPIYVNGLMQKEKIIPGRAIYNTFLVGNGLSLLYSFAGFGIIKYSLIGEIEIILGIFSALILLTASVIVFSYHDILFYRKSI